MSIASTDTFMTLCDKIHGILAKWTFHIGDFIDVRDGRASWGNAILEIKPL